MLIASSRFGDIRLGPDDAVPEFSFVSWTAMLFAAGMGIGLMYFGVGEPLQHYLKPPTEVGGTPAAAREALQSTFFHWGFHAWAVYGTMGLVLAYFGFRYNLPLTLRSGLYPLFKERINGPIGHGVDAFALVGTIAGGQGFTAVMVSWLAKFNPISMILTSFLLVFLDRGAGEISTAFGLNQSFADILSGIIIFFIIGCEFFITYRLSFRKPAKKEAAEHV